MIDRPPQTIVEPRRITRLVRLKELQHRVGLGRSTIYRWMAEGRFPKPVHLGGHAVASSQDNLDDWMAQRARPASR